MVGKRNSRLLPFDENIYLDLVIVVLLATLLIIIIRFVPDEAGLIRVPLGFIFVVFLPGYALVSALFPTHGSLSNFERIAFSFGLSIAIVPLIGLVLNYTPFGIRLYPILLSIYAFLLICIITAWIRRNAQYPEDRFIIRFGAIVKSYFKIPKLNSKLDKILFSIIIGLFIITCYLIYYLITTPRVGERFTEFYILDAEGKAEAYPTNLKVGEVAEVIVGVVNHEYQKLNYTLIIRLVKFGEGGSENFSTELSTISNTTTTTTTTTNYIKDFNRTLLNFTNVTRSYYTHCTLHHLETYEVTVKFRITVRGNYKLQFLLLNSEAKIHQNLHLSVSVI